MVSLRDPVRDNLLFVDFAQGAAAGAVLLAVLSGFNYERLTGKLSFVPLLASFALSVLLVLFGSGPGTSDAKVNLFGFQPVEIIRVLLVFFLAGYFARAGTCCATRARRRPALAALTSRFDIPPVEYTLPALVSVALSLAFFFLQKDMGPALVFACLFLTLYGIARGSAFVPVAGLTLLGAGFAAGYLLGVPHTVGERVSMWLSPWDNLVHGGDQLAHSLWAYATGGIAGTGIGRGDPQLVPAAHTDLILSALGEQWGFDRHRGGLRAVRIPGLSQFPHRPARALRLRILPGRRHRRRHRAADSADRRRLARRPAALRRRHAVPQLRPHRHAGQLRHVRHPAAQLRAPIRDRVPSTPSRSVSRSPPPASSSPSPPP